MALEKVYLLDHIQKLSANRRAIRHWIKKNPHSIVEILKTIDENVRAIATSESLRQDNNEYLMALSSVGTLANILSTDEGLKYMMKALPSYNLYDLLIWALLYLNTPRVMDLKKEILRLIRFVTRNPTAANQLRSNDNLYDVLKICLSPNNSEDIIKTTLAIIKNILDNIRDPKQSIKVVERLPVVELTDIASDGKGKLKYMSQHIFKKAASIRRLLNIPSDKLISKIGTPKSISKASSEPGRVIKKRSHNKASSDGLKGSKSTKDSILKQLKNAKKTVTESLSYTNYINFGYKDTKPKTSKDTKSKSSSSAEVANMLPKTKDKKKKKKLSSEGDTSSIRKLLDNTKPPKSKSDKTEKNAKFKRKKIIMTASLESVPSG